MASLIQIVLKDRGEGGGKCFFCGGNNMFYDANYKCVIYCPECNTNEEEKKRWEIINRYKNVPTTMYLNEDEAKLFYIDKYGRMGINVYNNEVKNESKNKS